MVPAVTAPGFRRALTPPPSVFGRSWLDRLRSVPARRAEQALAAGAGDTVLIVTAHPDDETLGVGATVASLVEAGATVHLMCATAGEAAYDEAGIVEPGLADTRRSELADAAAALGIARAEVGISDGHVAEHEAELSACGRPVSGFPVWAFHWSEPQVMLPATAEGIGAVGPPDVAAWTTELLVPM